MSASDSLFGRLAREIRFYHGALAANAVARSMKAKNAGIIPDDLEKAVDRFSNRVAFVFEDEIWTYRELDKRANRYAHWASSQGFKAGDVVALLMQNRPDFVACWFGLSKLGIVSALLNTNLMGAGLAHCIRVADAKALIVDACLDDNARSINGLLSPAPPIWTIFGGVDGLDQPTHDLDAALAAAPAARPPRTARNNVKGADAALLIYTSGTTGLPKAAKITHVRGQGALKVFGAGYHLKPSDRVYLVLPLYHSTGGLGAVGAALMNGGAVILRRKFSATHFWADCVNHRATVFVYIGELCRYLLNQPETPEEKHHKLRLAFGNGMRPDVWQRFVERFKIPLIGEFYGATESNILLFNFDGKMGALGRIPFLLRKSLPMRIVVTDQNLGEPVRDGYGLCIEAKPGEVGEILGEIRSDMARQRFDGYAGDEKQTNKKILHDVFKKGDSWFRSGDLMRKDKEGYYYFIDRMGDSYRWKGENVSTSEVAAVVSSYPGVQEANVYGVPMPLMEGRAGMAALVAPGVDLAGLRAYIARNLPPFARPLFIRLMPEIEVTGTFKYRKNDLVEAGFDPHAVKEPLFYDDAKAGAYLPLDADAYQRIQDGAVRF
ncbi:MAG: long-chain-acyl-CoA synthetase [Caulobacterales bacterium]